MNKSRVESAVQELPPRSGRSRTDASSMRTLDSMRSRDNLVLPADQVESEPDDDDIDVALSFLDPEEDFREAEYEETDGEGPAEAELEFNPLEPDDEICIEDLDPEESTQATPRETSEVVEGLLRDLQGPLAAALLEAERILGDPERVSTWIDNQARRRLLALAERFSEELRGTETKRALSSPPPAD